MARMNMRGSLNVSQFQKNPSQPRFYGRALIHGVEYVIKGWEKESERGPWISLLFEDPVHGNLTPAPESDKPQIFSRRVYTGFNSGSFEDDEVPF